VTIANRPLPPARALPDALPGRVLDQARLTSNATLVSRHDLTESLGVFTLERDEPLQRFEAGQYVSVGITVGGRLLQRPYSVVSLTNGSRQAELLVKRLASGDFSPRLWRLGPGTRLRVGAARGLFKWSSSGESQSIFVAAGTGVAPFVAMLDELRQSGTRHRVTVIQASSYADELAFGSRMANCESGSLTVDYRPTISRPADPRNAGWDGRIGRAEEQLALLLGELGSGSGLPIVYLCGGGATVEACSRVLTTAGVVPDRIRSEKFHQTEASAM